MNFSKYIEVLRNGVNLSRDEAADFLGLLLDQTKISDEQIAETLTLLASRAVTVPEVCGFVDSMRRRMVTVDGADGAVDTCGTGGDKSNTFNVSTASAILLSAGGVAVAKHGNRAATSKCGSYDVLRALGVPVELDSHEASRELDANNFVFLFAPLYHPALKRLAIIRKQMSFPTIFNILGPLLNPAKVSRQVIGTFSLANAELLAEVIGTMDHEHTIVLTSEDGLDEASLASSTQIFEIKRAIITKSILRPSDYGLEPAPISAMVGGDAERNALLIEQLFEPTDELSAYQRIVILNAGLGFYVAGKSSTIAAGVEFAKAVLEDGRGGRKLRDLRDRRVLPV